MPDDLRDKSDDWLKARLYEMQFRVFYVFEREKIMAELHRRREAQQREAAIEAIWET